MKKWLGFGVAAALCGSAGAATQSTTFDVTASVVSSCTVSATDLDFGDYDPVAGLAVSGTSTVTVTCSLLAPYNIGLGAGLHGGGVTDRKMLISGGGTETLDYSLTRDLAGLLNWGVTIGTNTLAGVGTGLAVPATVYGVITAGQNQPIGDYSDTITVTVTY